MALFGRVGSAMIGQVHQQARAICRPQLDLIYSGQKSAAEALGAVKDRVEQALNAG